MLRRFVGDGDPLDVVRLLNQSWRTGEVDAIDELFHPDAVIVHPGWEDRTEGREACVQSYIDFAMQATVHRLEEFDPEVDVANDTAVVSYGFEMDYEMNGAPLSDSGTDLYVLTRSRGGRWQVMWRTLILDAPD